MPRNWLKYFVNTLDETPISRANLLILREESKRRVDDLKISFNFNSISSNSSVDDSFSLFCICGKDDSASNKSLKNLDDGIKNLNK
jgi:hypothetical protein